MKIINPELAKLEPINLFSIRQYEYDNMMEIISEIIQPALDDGFVLTCFEKKPSMSNKGNIDRSIYERLAIKFEKDGYNIDLIYKIPKLIKNQYLMINGKQKIPLYQLFDIPIVNRKNLIKFFTNTSSLSIIRKPQSTPSIIMNFQARSVPFSYVVLGYFGFEETKKIINEEYEETPFSKDWFEPLVDDINIILEDKEATREDILAILGDSYSKYDPTKRVKEVLYALDIMLKVDVLSAQFFETNCMILEIVKALRSPGYDDENFENKRIRCWEYILFGKIIKDIYSLCVLSKYYKKKKYSTNSSAIMSEVNESDIVQFDFSINPIEELTKISRTSLIGPDGFKKKEVPKHLRDIRDSMFGRLCPVDTPDRENCGVLQNLLPKSRLDSRFKFNKDYEDKYINSIPVSMVPFLEHDDQTRLQMASSQMRQAIMLKNFQKPMIQSGCEYLYSKYTQFCQVAKHDGTVLLLNDNYMIVEYDDENDKGDIFEIGIRHIYVDNLDEYKVYFKQNDKFKKDDILFESKFMEDGSIQIGNNLLVGFMSYYGLNYEDGIVISDRLVKDEIFTSKHIADLTFTIPIDKILLTLEQGKYKPLPNIGDVVPAGTPYAKLKELSISQTDKYSIFEDTKVLTYPKDLTITKINIYVNDINESIPEFVDWITRKEIKQKRKANILKSTLENIFGIREAKEYIKNNNLDVFDANHGSFKMKTDLFDGIIVKMEGTFEKTIKVGDKIGNRHGNKGVITAILPEKEMPQLEDGRHMDVCLGPLGVPSRMNIGQLYEIYLTKALHQFKEKLIEDFDSGVDNKIIKNNILHFIRLVDKTKNNWYFTKFEEQMPDIITKEFINNLTLIQPPFESISIDDAFEIKRYTGVSDVSRIFEPYSKIYINKEIAVGYMYMFKMAHISEDKLTARSIGPYSRKLLQPLSGKKNKGGQKLGEMEQAALIAHDAPNILYESLTVKSDSIDSKNKYIQQVLKSNDISQDNLDIGAPESVKLLHKYCKVIGVDMDN